MIMDSSIPNLIGALPTAFVALIAVYIAYQQWRTNRFQLRHALFDRRFEIYKAVQRYLSDIMTHAKLNDEGIPPLLDAYQRAKFLFGSDIPEYIDVIYKRSLNMQLYENQYAEPLASDRRSELVKKKHEELTWLCNQLPVLAEKFGPYMSLGKA